MCYSLLISPPLPDVSFSLWSHAAAVAVAAADIASQIPSDFCI